MEELISVIIPIYNKEKYISDCLESILCQTYKNLEIILINDGSEDNSKTICEKYAKIDGRIKLISTENRGAARARNTGIELANGKYISFIDADDYISRTYYQTMYSLALDKNAQIVQCDFAEVIEGEKYNFIDQEYTIKTMQPKETLIELYGKEDKEHVKGVIMCNKLFNKNLFEQIRYVPDRVIDDETIIYKLIDKSQTIVDTTQVLYAYVQTSNSIMRRDFSQKRLNDSILVYDEVISYFKNNKEILEYVLKRAIFYYTEFIGKIVDSKSIEQKEKAIEYIKSNYQEKIQIIKNINQKVDINKLENEYEKELNKYEQKKRKI